MRPGPSSCQEQRGIHESAAASAGTTPPPMGRLLGTSYRHLRFFALNLGAGDGARDDTPAEVGG
jgi:hypothetical protein